MYLKSFTVPKYHFIYTTLFHTQGNIPYIEFAFFYHFLLLFYKTFHKTITVAVKVTNFAIIQMSEKLVISLQRI
jgi:hypothetical protein